MYVAIYVYQIMLMSNNNVRIKGLSGCLYALANGDGVSGNVGLSSSFKHTSPAFSINSFAYSVKTLKYVNTYNYMN